MLLNDMMMKQQQKALDDKRMSNTKANTNETAVATHNQDVYKVDDRNGLKSGLEDQQDYNQNQIEQDDQFQPPKSWENKPVHKNDDQFEPVYQIEDQPEFQKDYKQETNIRNGYD